jgi:uncharacterized protein
MVVEGDGHGRRIVFRTNVGDMTEVGPEALLRFERSGHDGLTPYVHVRRNLWARVSRALTYDLLALGEIHAVDGVSMFGIVAGGMFHPALEASQVEGLT